MKSILVPALLLLLCILTAQVRAQERAQVFTGATVIPIKGPVIEDGVLVIERGRIKAVGAR